MSTPHRPKKTKQIAARKGKLSADRAFEALLRRKALQAATVGAATALGESIPGLTRVLRLVLGELIDVGLLAEIQRELIEQTFILYDFKLPDSVHASVVRQVQFVGVSASAASDVVGRRLLQRAASVLGGVLARGVAPIAAATSSAASNAAVTYAIGKRAQAVAKLREAPIAGLPDAIRAFTGIDERRVADWSLQAVKNSVALVGAALSPFARLVRRDKPAGPRCAKRAQKRNGDIAAKPRRRPKAAAT